MASSGDTGATWADVVKSLMDTFQLLRDIFGYALPGLVFAGIGVASKRISLQYVHDLISPLGLPAWALVVMAISACYIIGHLLAAIAYLPIDIHKFIRRHDQPWLDKHPTEVCSEDLKWRHIYPEMFHDMDRRETMGLLMYSTLTAMALGWVVFYWLALPLRSVILLLSIFVFIDGLTLMQHLARVRVAIHKAGPEIDSYEKAHEASGDAKKVVGEAFQAGLDAVKKPAGK